LKKSGRVHRPSRPVDFDDFEIKARRGVFREFAPVAFGGLMLILATAFAGHYLGQNAVAHDAIPNEQLDALVAPASAIVTKGSLLPDGATMELVSLGVLRKQAVVEEGKGDFVNNDPGEAAVQIIPASVTYKDDGAGADTAEPVVKKLNLTPSTAKIEQTFKLKRADKQKVIAQRRVRLAEENCLARAVYFEARSESELGQLAVAKVILNRVKDPNYPKTICGVVYQGSGSRNSCQFSFACDGMPDDVKQPGAWANSKRIAQKAIAGDTQVAAIGSATNYHADYVKPRWARNMKRLIKIGHHIFYEDT
jgi:spore germination cell wall hydrolase CwlJ-like protein